MTASVPDALHVFSNSPKLVSPLFGTSLNKGRLTSVALRDPPCVKPELPARRIARDLEELLAFVAVVLPCRFEAILFMAKTRLAVDFLIGKAHSHRSNEKPKSNKSERFTAMQAFAK